MKAPAHILLLCVAGGLTVDAVWSAEPIVESGQGQWRYYASPSMGGEAFFTGQWAQPSYDDAAWPVGRTLVGYGDPDVVTEIPFGEHPQHKQPSVCFRRRFRIANRSRFRLFRGRVCGDDGAVVWVNGREVYRFNMPSGTVTPQTYAVRAIGPSTAEERSYHGFAIAPETLQEGDNVVAIRVHQANATSSDLVMDFDLAGLTTDEEVNAFRAQLESAAQQEREPSAASLKVGPFVRIEVSDDESESP